MALDFSEYFKKYETLLAEVNAVFNKVQAEHPECVACQPQCSDCCYALFDLTLIEALYLNHHFNDQHEGMSKTEILQRADAADRESVRIKRDLFRASQQGQTTDEILAQVGKLRLRCPLLGNEDTCELYDYRPVTCRLYGIPTAVAGEAHTCGKSNFKPGGKYPTVTMEKIQDRLLVLSHEFAQDIRSTYPELGTMLVPVSMALLNTYNEEYLGVSKVPQDAESGTIVLDGQGGVSFEESGCSGCASRSEGCSPDSCGKTGGE